MELAHGHGGPHTYVTGNVEQAHGHLYVTASYLEPLDAAQDHMRRRGHPVWGQELGSEDDATSTFQHLLRRGGHPEADDAEAFKHPVPGWNQSQLGRGDVGQLTVAIHPDRWDYGTLAHETAHALHQLQTGRKPASREHAHDEGFMEHYRTVGNMLAKGAGDELVKAHQQAMQKQARTDKWPPYLTEREDEYGDLVPVNESRHNPRGPVGTEEEAKAKGWAGPYYHGTSKRRAREIRNRGFRQPRMHNWDMSNYGTQEEIDAGNTHRTFFADNPDDALHFARGTHGDDADVVKAYLHPDHLTTEEGGGFMDSTQVKDVAHAMAIRPDKRATAAADPWDELRGQHSAIHRGFGFDLDEEDHDFVHDPDRPVAERAHRLLDAVVNRRARDSWHLPKHHEGLGGHWSTDSDVAHHFAHTNSRERAYDEWSADGERNGYNANGTERVQPVTRVILHAQMPERHGIASEDEDRIGHGQIYDYDEPSPLGRYEREVPIKRGHQVKITGISFAPTSHMNDDPRHHDRPDALTHHEFAEPQIHTASRPLYHGTAHDLDEILPADRHGVPLFPGLTRTDRAYATSDPQQARTYADISRIDSGGRPRVYEVSHTGHPDDLEPDPGYDADVMSPHGFRVVREVPEHELATMPRRAGAEKPIPTGSDLYYRFHHRDVPFGPEHARSYGLHGGDEPQPGYSSFASPHDLHHYLHEMDWVDAPEEVDFHDRDVIGFRGKRVGTGLDQEPLVMPHSSKPEVRMGWDEFKRRLPHTPGQATWSLSHAHRDVWPRTASIRMVPPEEYRKFSYPDYPNARTPAALVKHFKKNSPEYFEKIKNDVQQNGFTTPVLVRWNDPSGRPLRKPQVMEGHHRAAVAHELGVHLPVGDYDDQEDYDTAFKGGQAWFRENQRPTGDMPGKEGAAKVGSMMYHWAPKDARDDIAQHGLDHTRAPGFDRASHGPHGVFMHHDRALADDWVPDIGHTHDLYSVDTKGLRLHPDPYDTGDASYSEHTIPPERLRRLSARWMPTKRLFGPTFGLDHRLFDGDRLKHDVYDYILGTLDGFWRPQYGADWRAWARVYFAGSEASEWTSETLEGNNDFDVLVGVHYDLARQYVPAFRGKTDEEITGILNDGFRNGLDPRTDPVWIEVDGEKTGPWSNTWYVNKDSWDIRDIRPYAAYDVTANSWVVKPPHLPDWDISKFPEGKGLSQEIRGVIDMARGILRMPEPYRTQQGAQFWHYIHDTRSRAFGPQGEGWYDPSNVLEKALDQAGLLQKLWALMDRARVDPATLNAPAEWSNNPGGS